VRTTREEDIVVVGGGPAGAACACLLASNGFSPLVLERETEPRHKICGEFISIEAQGILAALGVDLRNLGGAAIGAVRLAFGHEIVEASLPFEGIGLTRRALDEALLRQAEASGARIRRGTTVSGIVPNDAAFDINLRDEPGLRAGTVFLATGKHDLRSLKRPSGSSGEDLIGFKTYWTMEPTQRAALEHAVEVILFQGGYAGLQCVEDGLVNLCLLVKRPVFEAAGRTWEKLFDHLLCESPHLRRRLNGAEPTLPRPLTIANVPYGFVHRSDADETEGLFRLGDQMGVIPSFCGDGVAMALHTARLAALTYVKRGSAASAYHTLARADIGRPITIASLLYDFGSMRFGRSALMAASRLYPGILQTIASMTRIQSTAAF
jgi:flavin-dependent dehydrogenase